MTNQAERHPLFSLHNFYIWEARRGDNIISEVKDSQPESGFVPTREKLIAKLSHQSPSRVYYSPDGRFTGRVLLFGESEKPYQAYLEADRAKEDTWETVESTRIASDPKVIEHEISEWRRQYGLEGNLSSAPSAVYLNTYATRGEIAQEFINIGEMQGAQQVLYHYEITQLGPRMLGIAIGRLLDIHHGELEQLGEVPEVLLEHANPFSSPFYLPSLRK